MKVQFLIKDSVAFERLGIMILSSLLKLHGHEVRLLITGGFSEEKIIEKVKHYDPKIIGYSMMTGEHSYYIELNKMLKGYHDFFAVFGGPHPTFMPHMIEHCGVDAICRGEGDIVFPELVNRLERGTSFYDINNFWFKNNDKIIRNPIGSLVSSLDRLPFPDRKTMYDADSALRFNGMKVFMSMRGCPFMCTYCFNHRYNAITKGKGALLRYRSVSSIIAEIREVKENFYLDRIYMCDDIFPLKPHGWLEEFAERISKEIGLPFFCNVRAEFINDEIGQLLSKMGCKFVAMGVECGNEVVAKTVLKRYTANDKIREACKILHKYKIRVMTQNLIGLPVVNPLDVDLETLDFNISLKPDYAWSSILYPYPETDIGKFAIRKGLFGGNLDSIPVSNKIKTYLKFKNPRLQRKIINLHKLFGIIVQFPALRIVTNFLISLPLTYLYTWCYFAFYGYKSVWKNLSWKSRREMAKYYITFYFKYVSTIQKRQIFSSVPQKFKYPDSFPRVY